MKVHIWPQILNICIILLSSGFSIDRLTAFIKRHIKEARMIEDTSTELVFQLPDDESELRKFENLFSDLERNHRTLGISSFGVSDTSLEEVRLFISTTVPDYNLIYLILWLFNFFWGGGVMMRILIFNGVWYDVGGGGCFNDDLFRIILGVPASSWAEHTGWIARWSEAQQVGRSHRQ